MYIYIYVYVYNICICMYIYIIYVYEWMNGNNEWQYLMGIGGFMSEDIGFKHQIGDLTCNGYI